MPLIHYATICPHLDADLYSKTWVVGALRCSVEHIKDKNLALSVGH